MKPAPLALLVALPLVAGARSSGPVVVPAAAPAFAVEEGTVLNKVFERTVDVTLEASSVTMDGEDMKSMYDSHRMRVTRRVELDDAYVAMGDGRPETLRRSYVALGGSSVEEMSGSRGDERTEAERSSELEGATVLFTWDADAEEYDLAFDEEEGDEDLLDGLEEDTDLRGFLPEGEVAEGDAWDVDADAFRVLFAPAGDVRLVDERGQRGVMLELREDVDGEGTATYAGVREVDDVDVAVIRIEAELLASTDMDISGQGEGTVTISLGLGLEGELLWDLQGGHFAALELSGDVEVETDVEVTIREELEMEQSSLHEGTFTFTATATPE